MKIADLWGADVVRDCDGVKLPKNPKEIADIIDEAIQAVAKARGEICLDGFLAKDESNMAIGQFEHGGVAGHPSDKGMEEMAELIF